MTESERMLGTILSKIADEISITPTMQEKAVRSYNAVGKWVGDGLDYDVKIMPQGSMNLGTVIKPIDDRDDYDLDLVCLLENGQYLSLDQIKNLVGNRLKQNETYLKILDKEGKRCWTMQYDEFHMDILPCVPKNTQFIEPSSTAIRLTHKNETGVYEPRYSNPYAYHIWFEERMMDILMAEKRDFAAMNKTEIKNVPTYKMRTPLQKVIQLLKRHRDICFKNDSTDAPISTIITTLAALAYTGETDVYDALCRILERIPQFIECRNGVYWIGNPVMREENFADKWKAEPQKRTAFMQWLGRARRELVDDPLACFGMDSVAEVYQKNLGEKPVQRAFNAIGEQTREAREKSQLSINGLVGGLSTSAVHAGNSIKGHTFWGE